MITFILNLIRLMKYLHIKIKGRVQGVDFRASTKAVADQLKIRGTIHNEKDGTISVEAEGDDQMMEQFLEWCQEGPEYAIVESIEVDEASDKAYKNFEVIR